MREPDYADWGRHRASARVAGGSVRGGLWSVEDSIRMHQLDKQIQDRSGDAPLRVLYGRRKSGVSTPDLSAGE